MPTAASSVGGRSAPRPARRRIWFQVHLWLGWITALPLLVVAVTGVLLAFEQEFYAWEQPEHYALQPTGEPMTLPEVLAQLDAASLHINHLQVPEVPSHAYLAFASGVAPDGKSRGLRAYVDPYRGTLTKEWDNPTFIRRVEVWHRNLGAGPTGRWIVGVSSALLVVISIAGLILWWPMRRGTLRRFGRRRGALDWHNVAGVAALAPLAVLGITGITFTWGHDVFPVLDAWTGTPSQPVVPRLADVGADDAADANRVSLATCARRVQQHNPHWEIVGVQGARPRSDVPYKFMLRDPDALLSHPSRHLYYDPRDGSQMGQWDAASGGAVGLYRRTFYVLHTAHPFPAWIRSGWALVSAAGALLVITGAWLSIRRWTANRSSG